MASLLLLNTGNAVAQNTTSSGYQLPPAPMQAIVDAPRPPQLSLSPKRDLATMTQIPALPSIVTVAQPELKLAGRRINPRTYSQSRFTFGSDFWLVDIATQKKIAIEGLPKNLSLADSQWSPDQAHIAFTQVLQEAGVVELWVIDVQTRQARKISQTALNTINGSGFTWMPDSKQLLVQLRANQQLAPAFDGIPSGPNTQETKPAAGQRSIRTFQDMLKNENDARLFEHYASLQLALLDLNGTATLLSTPDLFTSVTPSPNGEYLLTQRMQRPFSYLVPAYYFPKQIEVRDISGKLVHTVAKLPLVEGLPVGNDAVTTGVRNIEWRADAPASLVWAEALDGGDPSQVATHRDAVYMQAAPFSQAPVQLAKLATRYAGVVWGRADVAMVYESWWKTRQITVWRVAPDQANVAAEKLFSGSQEDRYNDPGTPQTIRDENGFQRLLFADDGQSVFLVGDGASPEGDRPFVDRWDLKTKQKTRLFRSEAPYYESISAVLDSDGKHLLTSRESPVEPPNYYSRNLAVGGQAAALKALTQFKHPTPQLKNVKKEQIRYKRKDGVELTGTLYLPPNYDAKRDGALPMLLWAYPTEFKSASAASQVTDSPHRFNAISYWGPQAFLAMGYGVLDDPSMPIVGEGDVEPNDTYLPQLIASAEAAIDELVRRGVGDRNRMAVGGHSYGAFMTGNLLAHTRLFKAGIARSGAYNRTLTPFGFQSEERNFWKAKDVYQTMSPFNYAENIKDALLMIHGEQDNNSGTFPIQSERMYAAIKGLGGTSRLVMLPNESHGYRARESILHMLYESNAWLE
ncbi:MAG: S9 family peptidase, partial [Arenimonas sp.]